MSDKAIAISLLISFLVGVTGGVGLYLRVRPTEEQKLQMRVDRTIKNELCDRIDSDIQRFKQAPNAFKRTALRVLVGESRAAARALLHDLPDEYPVRFSDKPEALVSECSTKARQWVKIDSVFPEDYEDEKNIVGSGDKPLSLERNS